MIKQTKIAKIVDQPGLTLRDDILGQKQTGSQIRLRCPISPPCLHHRYEFLWQKQRKKHLHSTVLPSIIVQICHMAQFLKLPLEYYRVVKIETYL